MKKSPIQKLQEKQQREWLKAAKAKNLPKEIIWKVKNRFDERGKK